VEAIDVIMAAILDVIMIDVITIEEDTIEVDTIEVDMDDAIMTATTVTVIAIMVETVNLNVIVITTANANVPMIMTDVTDLRNDPALLHEEDMKRETEICRMLQPSMTETIKMATISLVKSGQDRGNFGW
jgi:hypothetical protein